MRGSDTARFCDHCQKQVYDLSAMTRSEAERIVCQNAGSLCARFSRAVDGQVLTLDYAARPPAKRRWRLLGLLGLLGLGGLSWLSAAGRLANVTGTRVMGGVSCRPPLRTGVPYSPSFSKMPTATGQPDPADDFDL
jgi:hypothetical protein